MTNTAVGPSEIERRRIPAGSLGSCIIPFTIGKNPFEVVVEKVFIPVDRFTSVSLSNVPDAVCQTPGAICVSPGDWAAMGSATMTGV